MVQLVYDGLLPAGRINSGYPAPTVRSIKWNYRPFDLGDHVKVLACATSRGFLIFSKPTVTWKTGWHVLCHRKPKAPQGGQCVEWSPTNGRLLATGTTSSEHSGGVIRLLQYEEEKFRTKFLCVPPMHGGGISCLAFSADGNYLVASVFNSALQKASIVVLKTTSTSQMIQHTDYPDINCKSEVMIKFHSKSYLLVSSCKSSHLIWAWHKVGERWETMSSVETGSVIYDFSFSTNGTRLVVAGENNYMTIWKFDCRNWKCFSKLRFSGLRLYEGPSSLTWANDKYLVMVGNREEIILYETCLSTPSINELTKRPGYTHKEVTALQLDPSGQLLASGGSDGHIVLWVVDVKHHCVPGTRPCRFYRYEETYYNVDPWKVSDLDPGFEIEDDVDFTDVCSESSEDSSISLEEYIAKAKGASHTDTHDTAMATINDECVKKLALMNDGQVAREALIASFEKICTLSGTGNENPEASKEPPAKRSKS